MIRQYFFLIAAMFSLLISCSESETETPDNQKTGKISLEFVHLVEQDLLVTDSMKYINEAGNHYLITELQYFISDVSLTASDGSKILIDAWEDIWYVDNDLPSTQKWNISDKIPAGPYDSLSFTFGICEEKNLSLMFINPPERDMFWPEFLGGGYHYLKLNGKWQDEDMAQNQPFEFHLGIGQIYKNDSAYVPDIIGFIHNDFRVSLATPELVIANDETTSMELIMEIQNWFQNPYTYNHGDYAQNTMQSQEAMHKGCMNGKTDVFSIRIKKKSRKK